MFLLDQDGVLRAEALSAIPNLVHGFGTRHAENWPTLPTATLRQVHSDRVVFAGGPGVLGEADSLIANQPGFVLAVRTADCLPILIADPEHHAIAAVHAGWRGVVSGILSRAFVEMASRFDTAPRHILMAVGPAIGPCCFEVGPEVAVQFGRRAQKTKLDLIDTIRRQAIGAGVDPAQISVAEYCTKCGAKLFHSFRRDRDNSGRMISAIGWIA